MGDGDRKPPGNGNHHEHAGTHIRNLPSQHWESCSMGKSAVWGRFLHTQRSLAQLLPYATCVESSHMGVWLLQVQPIQVEFLVFRAIYVGTLQLQFKIEPWDFSVWCVGHVLSCCAVVWVCVILHMVHTMCATHLASLHPHIWLFSWLSIIVTRKICPYTIVGFMICRESSVI